MVDRRNPDRTIDEIYADSDVVAQYEPSRGLMPVELEIFQRHIPPGARVLDLGVGAGRTTAFLLPRSGEYIGLDLATAMVEACRVHFPGADIRVGDASDLADFGDGSFDVVLFSFNGIDHLPDDETRQRCLAECRRVLGPKGRIILSRHQARRLLVQPRTLRGVSWKLALSRLVRAGLSTVTFSCRTLLSRNFWAGRGYNIDPTHGGMRLATTTPRNASRELREVGFVVAEGPLAHDYPKRYRWWRTQWFYLVATTVAALD